jgi:hypothetical protein
VEKSGARRDVGTLHHALVSEEEEEEREKK